MLDTQPHIMQRSKGAARAAVGANGALRDLFQQGCAKAMLPKTDGPVPEVVFLNTSGGLTGGDRLTFSLKVDGEAAVMAATQTAERVYASDGGQASVDVDITVGAGATCLWLPQETVLFDHAALCRKTHVALGEGATFLGVETLVLGRAAMGERLTRADVQDHRTIVTKDGTPVFCERLGLDTAMMARADRRSGLCGQSVMSTLVFVAPYAEDRLEGVRLRLEDAQFASASAWDGKLVVRMLADDSWQVRGAVARVIEYLGVGRLPRVWQM